MSSTAPAPAPGGLRHPMLVVCLAVGAISTAAVLVRLADGASPPVMAFWRTLVVGLLLAPSLLRAGPRGLPSPRDGGMILVAGALLAGHFWVWFESLQHTTVARGTVLVCLTPIWVGLLEAVFLRRPPPWKFWPAIGVAVLGVGALAGAGGGGFSWQGDGLAILGGLLASIYLLVGRMVRPRVGIGVYGSMLCLSAAALLLVGALATGQALVGFSTTTWLVLGAMALGPQLMGHIGFNYAVRWVPAATIGAMVLLEPVGATVLGALVLGEMPGWGELAGGLLILAGVGIAVRAK